VSTRGRLTKSIAPTRSIAPAHQRIYRALKEAILTGELKPGDVLSEVELAQRWEVSRTPIREAIRQLEQENLIRWSPRRGGVVPGITVASVRDLYEVREVLEALSARLLAERGAQEDVDAMKKLAAEIEAVQNAGDYRSAIMLDDELHRRMARATRNRVLESQSGRVLDRVVMARMMVRRDPGRIHEIVREHRALLDALDERDPEKAAELAAVHVRNARVRLMEMLQHSSVDGD
jgi:DNA-binding GntR family transcriptional regulator